MLKLHCFDLLRTCRTTCFTTSPKRIEVMEFKHKAVILYGHHTFTTVTINDALATACALPLYTAAVLKEGKTGGEGGGTTPVRGLTPFIAPPPNEIYVEHNWTSGMKI